MSEEQPQPQPRRERLDVPSSSALERRLLVGDPAPRRPRNKPAIKPVPPSGLLGRLQAFLPSLEAANVELQQQIQAQPASAVAMERGSDDEAEGPYVEMDLACGLFDLKDEAAVAAAERAMRAQGVAVERFEGASTDDSSDDDGSGASDSEEEGEAAAGRQQRQQQVRQQQEAAGGGEGGCEAMQEDEPPSAAAATAAATNGAANGTAGGGRQQQGAPGRRRPGKKGARRHVGIEELS